MLRIKAKAIGYAALAIASAVTAIVTACKATLEAKDILANNTLTKRQKAVRIALAYALTACSIVVSGLSIKGFLDIKNQELWASRRLEVDREDALKMYRAQVSKEVKDEKRIWEDSNVLRLTGGGCPFTLDQVDYTMGEMVFYDQLHRTWYVDKRDRILNAEKDVIDLIKSGKYKDGVQLNIYFDKVGLPTRDFGEFLGWFNVADGEGLFDYSVISRPEDGLVYTVILYKVTPYNLNDKKEGDAA